MKTLYIKFKNRQRFCKGIIILDASRHSITRIIIVTLAHRRAYLVLNASTRSSYLVLHYLKIRRWIMHVNKVYWI
jgi:hypothetical protein